MRTTGKAYPKNLTLKGKYPQANLLSCACDATDSSGRNEAVRETGQSELGVTWTTSGGEPAALEESPVLGRARVADCPLEGGSAWAYSALGRSDWYDAI